jgi:hypothetical protein
MTATVRCPADVVWTRDHDRVVLVRRGLDLALVLCGNDAAIWDLMAQGHGWPKLVEAVEVVAAVDRAAAEAVIAATVTGLLNARMLEPAAAVPARVRYLPVVR